MENFDKIFMVFMIGYGIIMAMLGVQFFKRPMFIIVPAVLGAFIKFVILA